ncbi:hypothetical protein RvY_15826 [Ramazzottius varieornatus]|uniref:Major facilitator superfamily (MFS) profile domain-containing protein n=1 Tax=Ramazzottius varieornatus TaxID=947166 RepID=A0A1D1VWA9_RAMVA|nr:hypothetical protein RvY_15826 [Ramazzottius varieornatus]
MDSEIWEPRTSWVVPSFQRSSRRLPSNVGRAARYATSGVSVGSFRRSSTIAGPVQNLERAPSLDGIRYRLFHPPDDASTESSTSTEESFSLLKMSREEKLTLLCLAIVDMFSYLCMSIMAPFFPEKVAAVGASQTVSGGVFAVYALTVFVSSPVFAKLVPRIGAKFCFISGIFVAGGCNIIFGFLEDINDPVMFTTLAFAIRIVEGLGAGAFCTASFTILAYEFSGNVAVVFGTLESFVGLGMTIGPALGGFLHSVGGFRLPFFVVGGLMLMVVPLNIWLLPEHKHVVTKPLKGSQSRFFRTPSIYIVCFTIIVISSVWGFLDPTLQPHLVPFHLSSAMIGLVFLLVSATYAICSPVWGWITEKLDNTDGLMIVGLLVSGVALLFLGPSPLIGKSLGIDNALWINLVCLAVLGASISLAMIPTFEALLFASEEAGMAENIGTYALVSGVWGSAYSLGEVMGPALGGYLDDMYGFPVCSTVMASLCFGAAILFGLYCLIDLLVIRYKQRESAARARKAAMASWRVAPKRQMLTRPLTSSLTSPALVRMPFEADESSSIVESSSYTAGYGTRSQALDVTDAEVYPNIHAESQKAIPAITASV